LTLTFIVVVRQNNHTKKNIMEIFKVNQVVKKNPLAEPIKAIKEKVKEEAEKGNRHFNMHVSVPRGEAHIDTVTEELEKTTNLSFSRSKIAGYGLEHKDEKYAHWYIGVWIR
jgi:hypothetical protein